MRALEIACAFVAYHGAKIELTNLKLNKLVYYAQVESLRQSNTVLFDDAVEAWQYGPVVPDVYRTFKQFGRAPIMSAPLTPHLKGYAIAIVRYVADTYGAMTAFDLVSLSHRPGGAWNRVYDPNKDNEITVRDIVSSVDFQGIAGVKNTIGDGIEGVLNRMPNALKMLEDS